MKLFGTSLGMRFALAGALLTMVETSAARAQGATLSGRVTSESGQPIEVGNVFITEMKISVATGPEGRYTIAIPAEQWDRQRLP